MLKLTKNIFFVILVVMCFMNTQCEDDKDDFFISECDFETIINKSKYDNLETANFEFVKTEIIDDCLHIEISASGCNGDSWEFYLFDSSAIAESSPEQRYLKLQLINNEACLAVFKKTVSFDLTPLQINGSKEIILNLEGLESSLNYKY